jgi:hypothetical protein
MLGQSYERTLQKGMEEKRGHLLRVHLSFCSADFQSAVSPASSRQPRDKGNACGLEIRAPADWKSGSARFTSLLTDYGKRSIFAAPRPY